jgi:hypothetical protein
VVEQVSAAVREIVVLSGKKIAGVGVGMPASLILTRGRY